MADRHRVPALDHDPGEARDAEGLERLAGRWRPASLAILGTFLVRSGILDSIHAFGASTLGVPFVALIAVDDRAARSALVVCAPRRRCAPSTGSTRCCRARRSSCSTTSCSSALCFVVFWGTFFPLISEAVTGTKASRRAAVVRPLHGAAGARARAAVAGSARSSPGAGRPPPTLRRNFARAGRRRARGRRVVLARCSATRRAAAGAGDVRARRVRRSAASARSSGAASRARRAMTRRGRAGARSSRSCAATAAATAATSSTSGWRCCSSASRPRRRSSTRTTCACAPGQTAQRRRLRRPLRAADRHVDDVGGAWRRSRSARSLDVRRDGKHVATLRPTRGYYPSRDAERWARRAVLRRRGDERGRPEGRACARDVWTAMKPDIDAAAADDRARATGVHTPRDPASCTPEASTRSCSAASAARDHRALRRQHAAGDVPLHRLAARDVDLARRDHRLPRRPDRAVAGPPGAAPRASRRATRRASRRSSPARKRGSRGDVGRETADADRQAASSNAKG